MTQKQLDREGLEPMWSGGDGLTSYMGPSQLASFATEALSPPVERGWACRIGKVQRIQPDLCLQMRYLAREHGWSVQHLARRFHRRFGDVRAAIDGGER